MYFHCCLLESSENLFPAYCHHEEGKAELKKKKILVLTSSFSTNLLCDSEQVTDQFFSFICSHLQNEHRKSFFCLP